jgi:hypothetical protein
MGMVTRRIPAVQGKEIFSMADHHVAGRKNFCRAPSFPEQRGIPVAPMRVRDRYRNPRIFKLLLGGKTLAKAFCDLWLKPLFSRFFPSVICGHSEGILVFCL